MKVLNMIVAGWFTQGNRMQIPTLDGVPQECQLARIPTVEVISKQ